LKAVLTFIVSAGLAMLWAGPKAPGTAALARAALVEPGADQHLEGVGSLRRFSAISPEAVGMSETSVDDDTRFFVLRFSTAKAVASQVYIRNVALPAGAKLFLYGVNADGAVTDVRGPFEGAGPLRSGEFWSGAIRGDEIIAELQIAGDVPADLPFEVVGIAPAEPSEATDTSDNKGVQVRTSMFRGVALTHEVVDWRTVSLEKRNHPI
jgi:hypothetical protein